MQAQTAEVGHVESARRVHAHGYNVVNLVGPGSAAWPLAAWMVADEGVADFGPRGVVLALIHRPSAARAGVQWATGGAVWDELATACL